MSMRHYLEDHVLSLIIQGLTLFFVVGLFMMLEAPRDLLILVSSVLILGQGLAMGQDFYRRRVFYGQLLDVFEGMEKKHIIADLVPKAGFYEARALRELLQRTTKSMNDEISVYKAEQDAYRTYIETWIHEIKIPISGMALICDNNPSALSERVREEVTRIEAYVEQALYYARSTCVASDYFIKEVSVEQVVKEVIRDYSKSLIKQNTQIRLELENHRVKTDSKWLKFILGQIISNSMKYRGESLVLTFKSKFQDGQTVLSICDNGIGIPAKDLPKIFEKGFTGSNGRRIGSSTGIGLFLCKRLCDKMYLGLAVDSEAGAGTRVSLVFPEMAFWDDRT